MKYLILISSLLFSHMAIAQVKSADGVFEISRHDVRDKLLINSSYQGSDVSYKLADPYISILSDGTGYSYRVKNTSAVANTVRIFSQLEQVRDLPNECQIQYEWIYLNREPNAQYNKVIAYEEPRIINLNPGEENKDTGFLLLSSAQGSRRFRPGVYKHNVCMGPSDASIPVTDANTKCSSKEVKVVDSFSCPTSASNALPASRGMAYSFDASPNIYQFIGCIENPAINVLPSAQQNKIVLYWNNPTRDVSKFGIGAFFLYRWKGEANKPQSNTANPYAITRENYLPVDEGYYDISFADKGGTVYNIRSATFLAKYVNGVATNTVKATTMYTNPPAYCLDQNWLNNHRKPAPGF